MDTGCPFLRSYLINPDSNTRPSWSFEQENVDDFVLLNFDLKSIILNLMLTNSMMNRIYQWTNGMASSRIFLQAFWWPYRPCIINREDSLNLCINITVPITPLFLCYSCTLDLPGTGQYTVDWSSFGGN